MPKFRSINVNGAADLLGASQARLKNLSRYRVGFAPTAAPDNPMLARVVERQAKSNDETASRVIMQTYLEDAGSETLREITAPDRPELVPNLQLETTGLTPDLNARSIAYQQLATSIPIFGGRVVVDIDADQKSLIAINGKLSPLPTESPIATISPSEAWARLRDRAGMQGGQLDYDPPSPPVLTWHLDEVGEAWSLVYHFASVPLAPPVEPVPDDLPFAIPQQLGCARHSNRAAYYDYFVDAADGQVRFYFASAATLDVPAPMKGLDCDNKSRDFFGLSNAAKFLLMDPLRNIATYDYGNSDLDAVPQPPVPAQAIDHPTNDLGNTRPEAVSAHYNAKVVYDFYNDVLKRDSVDDKGMQLVSIVNVYSSANNPLPKPQWGNAVWWQGKMWYGQENGVSFAKHLDVIAHELTHGVTETSSKLIYRRLSGALNESFSDIFGIAIANWWPGAPNAVSTWDWEIGPGLGANGGPIRDFANPARAGQPDHMNQYRVLPISVDQGGVHIYSGIHNKAVHLLMTANTPTGEAAFPIGELMLLLYLTLTRLTPTSAFIDSRRTLENVVGVYHASDPSTLTTRLKAIDDAFTAVGIV
ncbi:bacillolysin/neutral peptidase B [Sphingomonas sp. OV641]|uniref:M4 family metallopeptidase n=1 Tax=Sphingomonas sp. OV641 TaxID=1881068 RepID=UPI0008C327B7|nr:M4 family metallopeptidase [Sphingomonas sp. OV641]SEJ83412.1 bacillolysin/neutral peptidase B [Sphingomonas sp. OV641]